MKKKLAAVALVAILLSAGFFVLVGNAVADMRASAKAAPEEGWNNRADNRVSSNVTLSSNTIYVPDNYSKIQWAVDNASAGDTIVVKSGTYYENVNVNKTLILRGVNTGGGNPVVDAGGNGSAIILSADGITLERFTATNSGNSSWEDAGIGAYSKNNIISDNTASNNNEGIFLSFSDNNIITNNNASSNNNYGRGISLAYSSNNLITNNNANNNNFGIVLGGNSSNNTISNNSCSLNEYGILSFYLNCSVISNNNCSNNVWGICFRYLNNSSISNNICCSNTYEGINLVYSNNNSISNNICHSNAYDGIVLGFSNNNNIANNSISSSNRYGIYFKDSSNNVIYLNNFINNGNVYSGGSTNSWNSTSPITYTYNGKTFTNYLGNYWDDYTDVDSDSDGIWDHPHPISSDKDHHPLVEPFENYFASSELPVHNLNTGENFSTIQAAIDAVNTTDGHTITVNPGTYTENVNVYKSLTIRSASGNPVDTIVKAKKRYDFIFEITANYVNVSGFTAKGATAYEPHAGIYLNAVNCCNISNNIACENNGDGIELRGSSNNTILNNTCIHNDYGIELRQSSNNRILNNKIYDNNYYDSGILLKYSSSNTILNNTCENNGCGIYLYDSSSNMITHNKICNNNMQGIHLGLSSSNKILNNEICANNLENIYFYSSRSNTILNNEVCNSNKEGIWLTSSSNNNIIHLNNFMGNNGNAYSSGSTNIWNSTEKITYCHVKLIVSQEIYHMFFIINQG